MTLLTVEGLYQDGNIRLSEKPEGRDGSRVIVTFLPEGESAQTDEEKRDAALKCLLARMEAGVDFGGQKFDRNAIYEERMNELDARRGQA